jgi:addiction module HigA family antidote
MIMKNKTHPGELLLEEVIKPHSLTIEKTAELMGVSLSKLFDLVEEKIPIDEELAENIARVFGGTAKIWINLQLAYDSKNT